MAIRLPANKIAKDIISRFGGYVRTERKCLGKPSPTKAEHVIEDLMGKVDMIIDGENPL